MDAMSPVMDHDYDLFADVLMIWRSLFGYES